MISQYKTSLLKKGSALVKEFNCILKKMFNKLTRKVITHRIINEGFIYVIENWESRQLIIGYEKEFVPSINSIEIFGYANGLH